MTPSWEIREGDCRDVLATLDAESVHTVVTSPPYFGLRDYGHDGQIGLEPTPDEFVTALVSVFREVRCVLRDDGTVWLNLGDSYAANIGGVGNNPSGKSTLTTNNGAGPRPGDKYARGNEGRPVRLRPGVKQKDLIGVPWMVAFALRADGWYLRSDIIWHKPNPMPESVRDRPTRSHEFIFLLSKSPRYYYDADAIREEAAHSTIADARVPYSRPSNGNQASVLAEVGHPLPTPEGGRNKRDVWTVTSKPFSGSHFATFPPDLIEPCILAGAPEGGIVLDPFNGAGTTGLVALRRGRSYIGIELNPDYAEMARQRIRDDAPLLNTHAEVAA